MDAREIQRIIQETARESARETLKELGVDDTRQLQADMLYLRKLRKGSEFVSLRVIAALVACMIPTFLYLLWEAIKNTLQK